jgi:hypothetical protein
MDTNMPSVSGVVRRGLVTTVLAFALVLMHGGIGQAMACAGMDQMATVDAATSNAQAMKPDSSHMVDRHSQHHQPGGRPTAHSAEMCVSTPAGSGAGSKAGPAVPVTLEHPTLTTSTYVGTVTRASGREPPAPDLVSVLCVNRV